MFSSFPREVACPKRHVVYNFEQMKSFIDKTNGKTNVFTTVHSFKEVQTKHTYDDFPFEVCDYSTAIVEKLFEGKKLQKIPNQLDPHHDPLNEKRVLT